MKRFSCLWALLMLMAVLPAAAQVTLGLKGGVNTTDMNFSKDILSSKYRCGWFFGPVVRITLPITAVGLDVAGLYEQREMKLEGSTVRQKSLVVPANLRLNFGLSSTLGIYVAGGPQFGFNVGDDKFDLLDTDALSSTFQLKKSSFSINVGAGIFLTKHLEVGLTYNIPSGTTGDASVKKFVKTLAAEETYTDKSEAKTWTLSAALYF